MLSDAPLKIEGLRVRAVRVPLPDPHRTASGVVAESPLVLTDVLTERRHRRPQHDLHLHADRARADRDAGPTNLSSLVAGEWLAPRELEQKLNARFRLLGTQGLVGMALAAIDMARGMRWPACTTSRWSVCWAASRSPCSATGRSATTASPAAARRGRAGRRADSPASRRRSATRTCGRISPSSAPCARPIG